MVPTTSAQPSFDDYSEYPTPPTETANTQPNNSHTHLDRTPKLRIEFVVIGGHEGKELHAIQSTAVYDALLWLAEQRPGDIPSKETDA
jgi:hypothetical protein